MLDGKASLEELFAQMDTTQVREELKIAHRNPEKTPSILKLMIQEQNSPEVLTKLVAAAAVS